MATEHRPTRPARIAVAIELDEPYPHHHGCYRGVLQYAEEHGWQCVVDPQLVGMTGDADIKDYDGIVGRINAFVLSRARQYDIPVVNLWYNSPVYRQLPGVFADYHAAGRLVAEHLLARGFSRFGYVGIARDRVGPQELAGFEQTIRQHGYKAPLRCRTPRNFEKDRNTFGRFRRQMRQWLARLKPPVGVFVPGDTMARYLIQICRETNLRVPHDVGVVAQYNTNILCLGTEPTLTSVEHDNERVGYRAAQLLDQMIHGRHVPNDYCQLVPPKALRVRASSDAFVCEDPLVSRAMRFISEHSQQAITVSDVAGHVNTTTRTLSRRFERYVGRSVYSEICRMRVEYLKRVLLDTDTPLVNLALDSGFSSTSHFTLFFRKATGMTPGQYRKKYRLGTTVGSGR